MKRFQQIELRWAYSRNKRRHTAWTERDVEMFWIQSCAPIGEIQGKHGYRLRYAAGGHIQYSKFVALLKGIASLTKAHQENSPFA